MIRVVLATDNADKAAEIAALLGDAVELVPRPREVGEIEENGETLEDNARIKAAAIADATGEPAVADDTGLEVDALGGAPGVYSARFAGPAATYADNVAKLLASLDAVEPARRRARFRTVALVRWPRGDGGDPPELVASGAVDGHIALEARGTNGFGYDPLFVPDDGDGRTFAEMTAEEKHAISHRGRAFTALAAMLRSL
ncbi:MAG TPA: RdgB/HAM1 family non-canonical purine NTP pyrophosphatase [Acidimicrobiales bacterium]